MVPTDGSGFDREAILVALRVAERCDAKIRLVRVLGTGAYFGMATSPESAMVTAEAVRSETETALGELYALAAECRTLTSATITADLENGPIADMKSKLKLTGVRETLTYPGRSPEHQSSILRLRKHRLRSIFRLYGNTTKSEMRMRIRGAILPSLVGLAAAAGFLTLTGARRGEQVERVDFDKVVRSTSPAYDARVAPVSDAGIKEFRIPIKDATLEIAKGVTYEGWTFGGTVPGPVVHEMETIAQVALADVSADDAVVDELEVDPVAVAGDAIVGNCDAFGVPEMDPVPRVHLATPSGPKNIAPDDAVVDFGQVNPEERVVEPVPFDDTAAH